MAIIIDPSAMIRVSAYGYAYLGDSYEEARRRADFEFAFGFEAVAVVGGGFRRGGTISTDPLEYVVGNVTVATMSYDLDRSFSVTLTPEGRDDLEQATGSSDYRIHVDYTMLYLADSPNVPAFAFGPNAFESSPPGAYAFREGYMTEARGNQSHAEGYNTYATGDAAHSEGRGTSASGDWAHAEGYQTESKGNYSHAEGYSTAADSTASHAEGYQTKSKGNYSHAEGYKTTATYPASHAEGFSTTASRTAAHAEGYGTVASADYAHAQNAFTIAASAAQTVIGRFNAEDSNDNYAFIIGKGMSDYDRSNALTVDWAGEVVAADPTIDRDGELPSEEQWHTALKLLDTDDDPIEEVRVVRRASGRMESLWSVYNDNDGATVENTLRIGVDEDGSNVVGVTDSAAWRSAIEALATSGGTLTGNLNMALNNGAATHLLFKDSRMDRSHGGVPTTGTQVERCIGIEDKNGNWLGRLTFRQEANGTKRSLLEAVGANASGSSVWNSITAYVTANGTRGYAISDPAAFCSALHVGDRVTKDQSTAVSMPNSAYSNICSISLADGTWVIEATAQFASNATGRRFAFISATSASSSGSDMRQTGANANAVSGSSTLLHCGCTKVLTATTTIYLVGWQNSGAALSTYGCISAVRVK